MKVVLDALLFALLGISVYTDLKHKKIYNIVLLPAVVVAIFLNFYFLGIRGGLESLKGMLLGALLLILPFALGGMGGGDVKLMAVVGAFKGPAFVWNAFIFSAVAGGILALAAMVAEGKVLCRLRAVFLTLFSLLGFIPRGLDLLDSGKKSSPSLPYGIAIAAGTLMAYLWGR
ncbi:A24 family peptidase [Caldanaerovirga acetigignens]|uniref:A24 family peptidase n=1 Tax=Caldanaerovirga acetigignens TaxID=447595 RepID=UPI00093488BD|nr:A24 family peptidase [Caldanaerovirga acetigignens]